MADTDATTLTRAELTNRKPHTSSSYRGRLVWLFESVLSHDFDASRKYHDVLGPKGSTTFSWTSNYSHRLIEEVSLLIRAQPAEPNVHTIGYVETITTRRRTEATALRFEIHPAPKTVRLAQNVLSGWASDSWFVHQRDSEILFALRQRIIGGSTPSPERTNILRSNASFLLTSEAQLEDLPSADRFAIIYPETPPWHAQNLLFQNARVVVGPEGAGFSNLAFTPPGAVFV